MPRIIVRTQRAKDFQRLERYRVCKCMKCESCQENARWEEIFNKKFADPDYYKERPIKHGCSLTDL